MSSVSSPQAQVLESPDLLPAILKKLQGPAGMPPHDWAACSKVSTLWRQTLKGQPVVVQWGQPSAEQVQAVCVSGIPVQSLDLPAQCCLEVLLNPSFQQACAASLLHAGQLEISDCQEGPMTRDFYLLQTFPNLKEVVFCYQAGAKRVMLSGKEFLTSKGDQMALCDLSNMADDKLFMRVREFLSSKGDPASQNLLDLLPDIGHFKLFLRMQASMARGWPGPDLDTLQKLAQSAGP